MRLGLIGVVLLCGVSCLVRAQPQGLDTLWTYVYASPRDDEARCIVATTDGGLLIGGEGCAPDSTRSALLIRLDRDGHERWVGGYRALALGGIQSIAVMSDGGYVFTRTSCGSAGHIGVVKIDSVGNEQWARCFDSLEEYILSDPSVAVTSDGGVVLAVGSHYPYPDMDMCMFVARLNTNGDTLWTQRYGRGWQVPGGRVLTLSNGQLLIVGTLGSDAWVFETDSAGQVLWSRTFGSPTLSESLFDATLLSNGDIVVAGWQRPIEWGYNAYMALLTSSGDTVWTRTFAFSGNSMLYSVASLPDNDILATGNFPNRHGDILALLMSPDGDSIWTAAYGTDDTDNCFALCLTSDRGTAMAGYRSPTSEQQKDLIVIRTLPLDGQSTPREASRPPLDYSLAVYPNPFNSTTEIQFTLPRTMPVSLKVYDVTGREVGKLLDEVKPAGEHRVTFDAGALPSGVYFCRLRSGEMMQTRKMLLIR